MSAMALKYKGLVAAFAVVLIAYWLYEPLFPDIEDLWLLRIVIALKKVFLLIGTVTESLGFVSSINITRSAAKLLMAKPPVFDSLQIFDDNFSGVPVRIFQPVHKNKKFLEGLPGLVYYHGGGWVRLDVDTYHSVTGKIADETGFVVISVDYRLAPEHIFPKPFDDCLTATVHLLRHGKDYGVDVNRIAVAGDSAGGNLAAAVALRLAVESDLPSIKSQVLIYPALQAFDFRTPSMLTRELPGFLTQKVMVEYWLLYYQGHFDNVETFLINNHTSRHMKSSEYGDAVDHSFLPEEFRKELAEKPQKNFGDEKFSESFEPTLLNPYFCPLMAQRLDKLPPTFMVTAEYDVLRDDGFMYAKRLAKSGVRVEHKHFERSFHGFISTDDKAGQKRFLIELSQYLHKTI